MTDLTVFYDGTCPLCVREMQHLAGYDQKQRLQLIDIHSDAFQHYPAIDATLASTILHGLDKDGQIVLGLDVTYMAWKLVGKGWLYAPLRWKGIRPIADWCYLRFANNRYAISGLLTGKRQCQSGQCSK
ncbi:thiol-disulfide oxidoreductase DCC family protein [Vibrio ostreicida]|uniref:thiol-disulfide oxidoreductase DCC family protein n=1 Tax=Vibrio ostreicida TaxID=526588 RepID=UPI003B5B6E45